DIPIDDGTEALVGHPGSPPQGSEIRSRSKGRTRGWGGEPGRGRPIARYGDPARRVPRRLAVAVAEAEAAEDRAAGRRRGQRDLRAERVGLGAGGTAADTARTPRHRPVARPELRDVEGQRQGEGGAGGMVLAHHDGAAGVE